MRATLQCDEQDTFWRAAATNHHELNLKNSCASGLHWVKYVQYDPNPYLSEWAAVLYMYTWLRVLLSLQCAAMETGCRAEIVVLMRRQV